MPVTRTRPIHAARSSLRPLLFAAALAFGVTTMAACAQDNTAHDMGYAVPADATLLSVSAQAEAKRVPDVATIRSSQ